MSNDRVEIIRRGAIAEVVLNRPEKLNALDIAMFDAIIEAGNTVSQDKTVRVVILRGAGDAFCAGLDLANFSPDPNAEINQDLIPRSYGIANKWQAAAWVWRTCPVPVIAAVHGVAYGGGLQIFSGADIKYIHPDTRLSIMEMKWGIIPDMGGTQLWRHNVREDLLKELTFTNRVFSGEQAVEYGFGTFNSDDTVKSAMALATQIEAKSPSAIVKAKKLINAASYLSAEDGLSMESREQQDIIRKENQLEAVFSKMQKRVANFKDYREPQ
ncbi:crotonase/enoyl-CoA hydratase family protein [Saprospiraceae bacterium]|nr:crotonase/enoyl-CoA hydratase family protein [Saprospiraceae bacterium]